MDLSALLPALDQTVGLDRLRSRMSEPGALTLGVADGAKAAVLAALIREALTRETATPTLIITPKSHHADALADELRAWLGDDDAARIHVFPERDALPYERLDPDPDDVTARLAVLDSLSTPTTDDRRPATAPIVIASAAAVAQRTLSPDELRRSTLTVAVAERLDQHRLLQVLDAGGYRIEPQVTAPGEASRRGGIVDVWPASEDNPLRIELFGDVVESIRAFDWASQRSVSTRDRISIGSARELALDRQRMHALAERLQPQDLRGDGRVHAERDIEGLRSGEPFDGLDFYAPFLAAATLLDHAREASAQVIIDEPSDVAAMQQEHDEMAHEARRDLERRGEIPHGLPEPHVPWPELRDGIEALPHRLNLSRWAVGESDAPDAGAAVRLPFAPVSAYGGRLRVLADELATTLRKGQQVVVVSTQSKRLSELLEEHDVFARLTDAATEPTLGRGALTILHGSLPHGWSVGDEGRGLTLLTDGEVFGFTKQRRAPPRRGASREAFLADLVPGQFVVHIEHGIAKFAGLVRRTIAGSDDDAGEREYLELHYADGDRLYVPVEQVDRVSRYVGPSEHRPSLTRLGSQEWVRAKSRVRRAVQELAKDLLELYAQRELAQGHAFPLDGAWETELSASFPYVETADQQAAIRDVKRDMESPRPMDRLVCGDVGYGKTEVAVRAAFKAVVDGTQAAVLVPTTVLAQQHYNTFKQRLAGFPVRVEMLSRFRTEKDQRNVVADLAAGGVDIVIGTHRLLQKDVSFKNLGLVIIDEEQRFGVAHKERLKQMRSEVDVLTLTATPIPRTLNMALTGVRDMSTIETPPEERLPIKTYVTEFDDHLVREAIVREMERGGQIYLVHNRVHNIELVTSQLRDLVPEAEILIGHGQMHEDMLERVMLEFTDGKADVLVCTTIIESGLDIPNVNTIVINNADKFGLAQLYQLRGRVGRGAARAYAYLLYEKHRALSEVAQKRLQTIFEATELGAGFQIALRDLEIRGSGNILGAEQSGQIGAVGFDLYVRLLADAVEGLKALARGEEPPPPKLQAPIVIDLPLAAYIPESYVGDLNLRLALYQRLAAADVNGAQAPPPATTATGNGVQSKTGSQPPPAVQSPTDTNAPSPTQITEDLERDLTDRFGPPPASVRNLLYAVHLRILARRASIQSVARENGPGGRSIITIRSDSADLRARLKPSRQRELERTGAVTVGHQQLRIDLEAAGESWRDLLLETIQAIGGEESRVAVGA